MLRRTKYRSSNFFEKISNGRKTIFNRFVRLNLGNTLMILSLAVSKKKYFFPKKNQYLGLSCVSDVKTLCITRVNLRFSCQKYPSRMTFPLCPSCGWPGSVDPVAIGPCFPLLITTDVTPSFDVFFFVVDLVVTDFFSDFLLLRFRDRVCLTLNGRRSVWNNADSPKKIKILK